MRVWVMLIAVMFSSFGYTAPKPEYWAYWDQSNETSTLKVDHQIWQQMLDTYLISRGDQTLFNYAAVTDQDKIQLQHYIKSLTLSDPRDLKKARQYAYWVNLYNAITVKIILDNYPVKSITKLGGFLSFGPWDDKVATVTGQTITLNDIEHRILRPLWNDPRTHYAVNCASLGCPNLQPQAFTADNTESLLDTAARQFINSDKGVKVTDNTLRLSSIYDWFEADFGGNKDTLLQHLQNYRTNNDLKGWQGEISYEYDWSLNRP